MRKVVVKVKTAFLSIAACVCGLVVADFGVLLESAEAMPRGYYKEYPGMFLNPNWLASKKFRKKGTVKLTLLYCDKASKRDINTVTCTDGVLRPLPRLSAELYHIPPSSYSVDLSLGTFTTGRKGTALVTLPVRSGCFYVDQPLSCTGRGCPKKRPLSQPQCITSTEGVTSEMQILLHKWD